MEKLFSLLKKLEENIPLADVSNPDISSSSVGWHIDHAVMVINNITEALKSSDASKYEWKFSLAKTFVYTIGKIPRGKVKAPFSVQPKTPFDSNRIASDLKRAKENLLALDQMPTNKFFLHPYFGNLKVKPARKFMRIHTRHHLKIILDIVK